MLKLILILAGTISLSLGIIGVFVPGLPTTPFVLLSAGLYVRSSERLYQMLINNKYLGKYILKFRKEKGMGIYTKIYSILLMWIMISISVYYFIDLIPVKLIVIIAGITGTIVMGFIVPTTKKN